MLPLFAALACHSDEPTKPDPTAEDTAAGSADTALATDTGSVTTPPPPSCVREQPIGSGAISAGWRSPSGTLYVAGDLPASRVREPDGTWREDPFDPGIAYAEQVTGGDDDTVYAFTRTQVLQRAADGTWADLAAPVGLDDAVALHAFGPDDLLVLKVVDYPCADCGPIEDPSLLTWDGATWTEQVLPTVYAYINGFAVLPDRTAVLLAGDQLRTTAGAQVPLTDLVPVGVDAAPDGTLVAYGYGGVAIGSLAGLVTTNPGADTVQWDDVYAASSTDIWASGTWWVGGVEPHATVAHWDGVAWTEVAADLPGPVRLAGGDGEVFVLGSWDHERVLVGDASGLTFDRETWGPAYLKDIVVDDVTGLGWGTTYFRGVLDVFEDGGWRGEPLPTALTEEPNQIAASDGRVGLAAFETLAVYEGGAVTSTETPQRIWSALAGADGVLFAAGRPFAGDDTVTGSAAVMREAGAGWEDLDLTGLPPEGAPISAWADGPDDLWLGLDLAGGAGALAHWDGAAWTVPLTTPVAPASLRRQVDGQLTYTQFQGAGEGTQTLWTFDGTTAAPISDTPLDVREAHLLADGTWFATAVGFQQTADHDLVTRLMRRDPGGSWVEAFQTHYVMPLAGTPDLALSRTEEVAWTWDCTPTGAARRGTAPAAP
ncbi:MAG: hypothetical protein R3F59_35215 [Myxococcota bacterium]